MAFCQKEYVFSHIITKDSRAHQPALFQLDLRDLIQPLGECSPMFVIDSMSVTAYKQGTSERIPVKFAVLNASKTRALTNDPCRLSSKWNVELGGLSSVKIAGTDKTPFHRSLSVYDEDNRQAMLNIAKLTALKRQLSSSSMGNAVHGSPSGTG
ncbi:hypothetical protein Q5P01_016534 [Channa striata]|uniref:Uncharacterized protein n=1 Tax=Channa striata TaxID=64152 RepID=A0AA88SFR0_CHASR|nr:hypothetical protein Q5P01_016534 [Channa striata]